MCSQTPPPAPDYRGAAEETTAGNLDMLDYSTTSNRYDEFNPWGQTTWERGDPVFDESAFNSAQARYESNPDYLWDEAVAAYRDSPLTVDSPNRDDYLAVAPSRDSFMTPSTDWTRTNTLNPDAQSAYDNTIATQNAQSELALSGMNSVGDMFAEDFNWDQFGDAPTWGGAPTYSGPEMDIPEWQALGDEMPTYGDFRDEQYDALNQRINKDYNLADQQKSDQLVAQGIPKGSERWNTEMRRLDEGLNDARDRASVTVEELAGRGYSSALQGRQQRTAENQQDFVNQMMQYGMSADEANAMYERQLQSSDTDYRMGMSDRTRSIEEAMMRRQTPLNEVNAFMSGGQIQMPTFSQTPTVSQIGGTDYLTAAMNQGQYDTDVYNANTAGSNNTWNTLAQLGTMAYLRPPGT